MTQTHLEHDYRLKFRLDECGDPIAPGRHGHLYLDEGKLCLMAVNGTLRLRSRWKELGGTLWMGDISKDADGKRVQDVEVKGIDPAKIRLAIRLIGVRPKRVMSEAQIAVLAKARLASPLCANATPEPGTGDQGGK